MKTKMKYCIYLGLLAFLMLASTRFSFATIYEAETAQLYKAIIEDKNGGFSGDAYINFDNEPGSYLIQKIGMAADGEQTVKIRFANGTTSARIMNIFINDTLIAESLLFQPTGDWTIWDTLSVSANFKEGVNNIKCVSVSNEGGPNIDLFDVSGEQAPTYSLNLSVEGSGQIQRFPNDALLFEGEQIILVARADYNTVFFKWTGDVESETDTLKFTLDGDKSITAYFVEIEIYPPDPDFSMMGYATVTGDGVETTTGGEGGKVTVIENLDQLIAWGASRENNYTTETVIIRGYIEAEETTVISIKRGKDISILGDSESNGGFAELKNISLNIRQYSNVIIRNLKMHEVIYPDDDLTIDECHHVWIDHCEFHSKIGPGIGVDTYDGLLDIKKGSHNVTVSWCHFHDHMKTVLIGHSDNNGDQDVNLEVTFHHNWFSNTDGRNPSLRFGKVHYFNNYLENIRDYGFAVRNGAHAKIENCHFESVNIPVATDKFEGHGFACISNCIYSGSCSEADNQISEPLGCDFWNNEIPYSYALESTNTVKFSTQTYAGVGVIRTVTSSPKMMNSDILELKKMYFDPVVEKIELTVSSETFQKITISVFSIDGKTLRVQTQKMHAGINKINVQTSRFNSGIFILNIESSNERISRKIALQ